MKREETFKDILKPRNTHFGIVKFMTRSWSPRKCISNGLNYSSEEIKNAVSKSVFLDSIIEAESAKSGVCKEQLKKEIATYLDEIALDKKMHVVRWMGVFFLKMAFMMKIGIFVNEASVLKCCSCQLTGAMLISTSTRWRWSVRVCGRQAPSTSVVRWRALTCTRPRCGNTFTSWSPSTHCLWSSSSKAQGAGATKVYRPSTVY
ncbi:unnamed protein product [Leptidea sinapis]|uniref:Uncharacterized protein n=1 Tax=Leptidea sinapis TaxID=189913 RepID=A0A5E4Q947_9NEOP|nr:unnamed protein product [Leptidea sinapis]